MSEGAETVVITQFPAREERAVDPMESLLCQDARGTLGLESSVKSSYLAGGEASLGGEREDTPRPVSGGTEIL